MPSAPVWIRTPGELAGLARSVADAPAIALDTEADSLHHYPERLCLIQLADPSGRVFLVDPLALPDLEPLRPLLADREVLKVFHSAENDLGHLKRRYGFTVVGVADTMLAARFLGLRTLGLDVLLERYLGVQPSKSQQKTDWARRPLTAAQEVYAAEDVRHLVALHERLTAELVAIGRDAWVAEECEAVAAQVVSERVPDADGYRRIRGASQLDAAGLRVLRALHARREAWARAERRPPFKVLSPETLLALATLRPRTRESMAGVPGLSAWHLERYGAGIREAVEQGLGAAPDDSPPAPARRPVIPAVVQQRAAALKSWRAAAVERVGLEAGVLLPQRLIDALAADPPRTLPELAERPGVRRWRTREFGAEILAALGNPDARPSG